MIWIGTDHGGINIVNKKSGKITYLSHNEKNQFSITQNTVKCLYRDDTGIMWVGTYKMGVCYYHESVFKFKSVTEKAERICNYSIRNIADYPNRDFYINLLHLNFKNSALMFNNLKVYRAEILYLTDLLDKFFPERIIKPRFWLY